jgi:hypothetical protein
MSKSTKEKVNLGIIITMIIMLFILFNLMNNSQKVHERLKVLESEYQQQIEAREYEELIRDIIEELEARQ